MSLRASRSGSPVIIAGGLDAGCRSCRHEARCTPFMAFLNSSSSVGIERVFPCAGALCDAFPGIAAVGLSAGRSRIPVALISSGSWPNDLAEARLIFPDMESPKEVGLSAPVRVTPCQYPMDGTEVSIRPAPPKVFGRWTGSAGDEAEVLRFRKCPSPPFVEFNKGVHVHEHVNAHVGETVFVDVHVLVDVVVDGFSSMWLRSSSFEQPAHS